MSVVTSIEIQRLDPKAVLPTRAHPEDAGLDLYAFEKVVVGPGQGTMARTGVALAVPPQHVGMICDRSSLAKKGLKTAGGIVDAGYRGEVMVVIRNLSNEEIVLQAGERLAQLLILPIATPQVQEVTGLSTSARGTGGFGSTGR